MSKALSADDVRFQQTIFEEWWLLQGHYRWQLGPEYRRSPRAFVAETEGVKTELGAFDKPGRSGNGSIVARHFCLTYRLIYVGVKNHVLNRRSD
ncbi:MAG: hypothetical protein ACXWT1_10810 [Methylobacter sp.]